MATAEPYPRSHDRSQRRKPFSSFMKRLANLKNNSDSSAPGATKHKKNAAKNNPYPESGRVGRTERNDGFTESLASPVSRPSLSTQSQGRSISSGTDPREEHAANGSKSAAPTVSTKADTTHSDGQSKAGTVTTAGGAVSSNGVGGEGSTFSSPAPSVRSLTTTLTTIQSSAPANTVAAAAAAAGQTASSGTGHQSVQFTHQFPSSPPASAVPSHVVGHQVGGHPTYNHATANNLLTDNASILTLASSSKRRRRNSVDTNASVRALAPSSIFGGSRESLPLSVLSANIGESSSLSAVHNRPAVGGTPAAERASVYSSSGVAPALASERNSYIASKQTNTGDGASVRSGLAHHGRNDSVTGSIGGQASPLASPREPISSAKTGQQHPTKDDGDEENEKAGK